MEVGAGNTIIWFAVGTALGASPYQEVVIVAGAVKPQEFATTLPGVELFVKDNIGAVDPVTVTLPTDAPSVVITVVPLSVIELGVQAVPLVI